MKTLIKKLPLLMVLLSSFCYLNTNAKEVYYTNASGVEMTKQEYDRIVNMLPEKKVEHISEQEFQNYIVGVEVDHNEIYYKVISNKENIIYQEEITKEEYDSSKVSSNKVCDGSTRSSDYGYYQTSYKKLSVTLNDLSSYFKLIASLDWLQVPYCRSYDVFAFRTTRFNYSNVLGVQTYYVGNSYTDINYNTSSPGYKGLSNGAGISMNLKDDSNITDFDMVMTANLTISDYSYAHAYVITTYQHAQSDLTRNQSMSYTLQAGGLGNAVYYSNTTIRNKYDGMPGVELSTTV